MRRKEKIEKEKKWGGKKIQQRKLEVEIEAWVFRGEWEQCICDVRGGGRERKRLGRKRKERRSEQRRGEVEVEARTAGGKWRQCDERGGGVGGLEAAEWSVLKCRGKKLLVRL